MKINMKKIISLLLILCMMVPFNLSYAADSTSEADYKGILDYLGITTNIKGEHVTRGELMVMACDMLGLKNIPSEEVSYYVDVPYDSPQLKYINQMTALGYARGIDGSFFPDRACTVTEFVTMMVRVTGYDVPAEIKGGYPAGYLMYASSNRILRGGYSTEQLVDAQTAIKILYNTLNAPFLKMVSYSQNPEYESSTTILYEIFKCEKLSGIVVANDKTELYGSTKASIKTVDIKSGNNRKNYRDRFYAASDYIGYNIEFLLDVSVENEETIVYATPTKNQTHEIDKKDITSIDSLITNIKYYLENADREYQVRVSQNAAFIYNGEGTFGIVPDDLTSKTGHLKLISNDGDTTYDVIIIEAYDNEIVENVNKLSETVSIKIFACDNVSDPTKPIKAKTLSLNTEKFEFVYIYKNGMKTEFSAIAADDIISYGISKSGQTAWAYVSSKGIKGKINEISDKGYVIDEVEYLFNDQFLLRYPDIKVGMSGRFGLDKYDNLVSFKADAGDGTVKYGYLMSAAKPKNMENTKFKILTADNKIEVFELADKTSVYIDNNEELGANASTTTTIFSPSGFIHQVIGYELNLDNEIRRVYVAKDVQDVEDKVQTGLELNGDYGASLPRYYASALDLLYYLDKSTTIFYITTEDDGKLVSEDYSYVSDNSRLADYETFNCRVYNVTYDRIAKIMTILTKLDSALEDPSEETVYMNHLLVIDKISTVVDSEGSPTYKLSGAFNGKISDFVVEKERPAYHTLKDAKPGQAWRIIPNKNGEIAGAKLIFDPQNGTRLNAGDPLYLNTPGIYNGKTTPLVPNYTFASRNTKPNYMVGSVYYKSGTPNALHIEFELGVKLPYFLDGSLKVCIFDMKTKKLTMGGVGDISVDSSANRIFSANRGGFPRTLVVYKNID